jgi:Cys-Gly metallodipeptidase DUG1
MTDLVKIIGTVLAPGSSRVVIPGFSSDVAPGLLDLAWRSATNYYSLGSPSSSSSGGTLISKIEDEYDPELYRANLGVPALAATSSGAKNTMKELLEQRWCRPTLSVVDVRTGGGVGQEASRFGPTRFSVIPRSATAKVSIRFVPKQDPDVLFALLKSHVESEFSKLGSMNRVELLIERVGGWWEADEDSAWLSMLEDAIEKEWGNKPLYVREGGTMPVARLMEELLLAPAVMIPMGQSSDAPHLANERIRRSNLIKGKNVVRRLLEDFGARS